MKRIYIELPEHAAIRFIVFSKHQGILLENLCAEPVSKSNPELRHHLIREELPDEVFAFLAQQSSELLAKRTSYRPYCTADKSV